MPSFLSDLRRLSKGNVKPEKSTKNGNRSSDSSSNPPSNKSSSTVNTAPDTSTPPSIAPIEKVSSPNGAPPVPTRPHAHPSSNSRYSIIGGSSLTLSTSVSQPRSMNPTSPFAPRVVSVSENSWVHQKVLLIYGQIADPSQQAFDGSVWVCHHQDSFPATVWPVSDSHFKALVHLQPGPNRLRLDFVSPKVPTPNGSAAHSSWININYLPLISSPPLELVIMLARDSPGTFDAVPERIHREGNGVDTAIRKYKMAAYLWQAFTGEQMSRNSFGRRCFRLEEEWQQGTLSSRDFETGQMRNEAKIHVIRSNKTLAEIRDAEVAQQNPRASRGGDLFSIAGDAVREYFHPKDGQTRYISVLIMDSHWDKQANLVRGHAAVGGGGNGIQLAVFGSHALQSYPSSIEEVVPAFTDCTKTDTNYVANDLNESGSNWEAANIGLGAHMHEVGHLLGCPHQESGVMLRDYVRLNRTFTCRESFSTRTKSPGMRLCLQRDECAWHRLDTLRFRYHPCFRLPSDPSANPDDSVQVWTVDNGNVLVTSAVGIGWIEIYGEGDTECKAFIEYVDPMAGKEPPKQITLAENDLRSKLPSGKQKKRLKLEIHAAGQGQHTVDDFSQLTSKISRVKLSDGRAAFRGGKLGFSQMDGSHPQEIMLWNVTDQRKLMTSIKVYSGFALDGVEFMYEDSTSQLFGNRGGKPGGSEFALDTRRGEIILGFYLRAGLWIDGIQILTSLGRKSEVYGNPNGGSGHTLIPPRGYNVAGISGSCAAWIDGFSLVITR
ncbi:MAG: hypothetical protein M1828_003819 [Chrysothrix sp. TS-e1954]|nr:MAG: hypothetical protein M1828_003819 [Chrysothrix sp. TS-e1954]